MPSPDRLGSDVLNLERRHAARKHVILRVQIIAGTRSYDAVMLDVSDTGAQLQLRAPAELPARFVLRFSDGSVRMAEQRWCSGLKVGVAFLPDAVETPAIVERPGLREIRAWIERLRGIELAELFNRLNQEDHYGSEEVRVAVRDLDLSVERLRRAIVKQMKS